MTAAVQYMAHSELPLPLYAKSIKHVGQDRLLDFLNTHSDAASKFTIDGGNVGKPIVCAFFRDATVAAKSIMLNSSKEDVYDAMTKNGYKCSPVHGSRVIKCVKEERLSKL